VIRTKRETAVQNDSIKDQLFWTTRNNYLLKYTYRNTMTDNNNNIIEQWWAEDMSPLAAQLSNGVLNEMKRRIQTSNIRKHKLQLNENTDRCYSAFRLRAPARLIFYSITFVDLLADVTCRKYTNF
jgi:hypothetical protein